MVGKTAEAVPCCDGDSTRELKCETKASRLRVHLLHKVIQFCPIKRVGKSVCNHISSRDVRKRNGSSVDLLPDETILSKSR